MTQSTSPTSVEHDPFLHKLGIHLSRSLSTLNPNPVLASRVYSLSKSLPSLGQFSKALLTFGKFTPADASDIWDLCQSQDSLDHAFVNPSLEIGGMIVTDHDVLNPDKATGRAGLTVGTGGGHTFKAPSGNWRRSELGLDRLALEKRREREDASAGSSSKRAKYDAGDYVEDREDHQPDFKSWSSSQFSIALSLSN